MTPAPANLRRTSSARLCAVSRALLWTFIRPSPETLKFRNHSFPGPREGLVALHLPRAGNYNVLLADAMTPRRATISQIHQVGGPRMKFLNIDRAYPTCGMR